MGKKRAYGSDAQLLGAFETTYGTAPDGSGGGVYTRLLFKSTSLGGEKPLGYDPLLGQGADDQDPYYEAESVSGDIVVPLDLRASGFWLKGLFGAPDTTDNGDGTYTHVFTSGGELPSLTLNIGHTGLTTPKHFLEKGVKLGSLEFSLARTGLASVTISAIAQGETEGASAPDAAPEAYDLTLFNQSRGSIKVDGVALANVTGGKLTFSNNLEAAEDIRDDGLIDGVDETNRSGNGTMDLRFTTDTTLPDAIDAETPVAVEYGYSIAGTEGYALTYSLPRVFAPKKKKEIGGPGGISASYDWRAAKDPTEGYMLQVSLTNDVASY